MGAAKENVDPAMAAKERLIESLQIQVQELKKTILDIREEIQQLREENAQLKLNTKRTNQWDGTSSDSN